MADTARTLAALQALLADNTSAAISPQDIRDFLVSVFPQTTKGDLPYIDPAGIITRLPATTDGYVLTLDATVDAGWKWAAAGSGGGGSVATDTIWDAAGDIAYGTGADTAAVMTAPATAEQANTTPSSFSTANWGSQTGVARKVMYWNDTTNVPYTDYIYATDILTPTQVLTFTATPAGGISGSGLVASSGTDVVTFAMTYQGTPTDTDIDIQSETYAGSPEVSGTDYPVDAPLFTSLTGPAINRGTAVGESVTFRVTATVSGATRTKDVTVTYNNYRYWGVSTEAAIDTDAEIDTFFGAQNSEISNSISKTFAITAGTNEYIYWIQRAALATPTFTVGGFAGGFSLIATVTHTNSRSFSESYEVWRSDNHSLGSTTVVVA